MVKFSTAQTALVFLEHVNAEYPSKPLSHGTKLAQRLHNTSAELVRANVFHKRPLIFNTVYEEERHPREFAHPLLASALFINSMIMLVKHPRYSDINIVKRLIHYHPIVYEAERSKE